MLRRLAFVLVLEVWGGGAARAAQGGGEAGPLARLPPHRAAGVALQVLLSRSPFQPGSIDGEPGANTWTALQAFQEAQGLPATGRPDPATLEALHQAADAENRPIVRDYTVTDSDLAGPFFQPPPGGIYAAAELPAMAYTSPWEELAERFQVSPRLLARLNPDTNLDKLKAGDVLVVPDATPVRPIAGTVARIVIDVDSRTLSAYDEAGNRVREYPTVVGKDYAAYRGMLLVDRVAQNPEYLLDPKTWEEIPDTLPPVTIQPGPNSPVGIVWMGLSKEGYGIHGTSSPELIGHTESHGCVRLTNWSARELSEHVEPNVTQVEFVGKEQG